MAITTDHRWFPLFSYISRRDLGTTVSHSFNLNHILLPLPPTPPHFASIRLVVGRSTEQMSKQVPSTSYTFGHATIVDHSPATGERKAPMREAAAKTNPVVSTDTTATKNQHPYDRKASSTSGPGVNRLADPKDLERLDATAKELYKSDLEILTYIETLKQRTAAIMEQVKHDSSVLYSNRRAMERIELYTRNWQRMDGHWTEEELNGDWHLRAELQDRRMTTPDPFDFSDEEGDAWYVGISSLLNTPDLPSIGTQIHVP